MRRGAKEELKLRRGHFQVVDFGSGEPGAVGSGADLPMLIEVAIRDAKGKRHGTSITNCRGVAVYRIQRGSVTDLRESRNGQAPLLALEKRGVLIRDIKTSSTWNVV